MTAKTDSDKKSEKTKDITIALDAMGGDHGVEAVVPGANIVHKNNSDVRFIFFGDKKQISDTLDRYASLKKVSTIVHCSETISGEEKPSAALRKSKDTSMRCAIEAVKNKEADAVVSAGNTGALMALAKLVLKSLPAIHRPAIASVFPTKTGSTIMLDLGANVLVDGENLAQFAVLGAVFSKAHCGKTNPTIGLLNVGTEKNKGPEHIKAAAQILANVELPGRYYGFVEGNDITAGTVDVIVSDGYAGNIALKTAEGVGSLTGHLFKKALFSDPLAIVGRALSYFALKRFKKRVDPRRYNGGVFLGLNGLCVKSHGGADSLGFSSAVEKAIELCKHDYITIVSEEINNLGNQDSFLSQGM